MQNNMDNRVDFDISWWKDKDQKIDQSFGDLAPAVKQRKNYKKARYNYHRNIRRNYRQRRHTMNPPLTQEEKESLKFLKDAISVQRERLYPNKYIRAIVRVAEVVRYQGGRLLGQRAPLGKHDEMVLRQTTNRRGLADALVKNGFGQLIPELDRQLQLGLPEFQLSLPIQIDKNKSVEYRIPFHRNADSTYTFDRYDALLAYEKNPENNRSRTFKVVDGHGITASQSLNLLEGRAVERAVIDIDGRHDYTWVKLNFEERDMDRQFKMKRLPEDTVVNMEKAFSGLPFRELDTLSGRDATFHQLRNGDLVKLTYDNGVNAQTMYAYADPMNNEVIFLDQHKKAIKRSDIVAASLHAGQSNALGQSGPQQRQDNPQQQFRQDNTQQLNHKGPQVRKPPGTKNGLRMI